MFHMQTVKSFPGADIFRPRTATNSMPMYMNYVQCTGKELNLLDCSYSRNRSDIDHSEDLGIKCRLGRLLQAHSILMAMK